MRGLLILMFALGPAAMARQEPEPTFRSGVAEVRLDATVQEGQVRVHRLQRNDFVLTDEGHRTPIASFAEGTAPLDLVLLLDVSGSVHRMLDDIARIAATALRELGNEDRVAVLVFSRGSKVETDLTGDRDRIATAIRQAAREPPIGSGTRIHAAVIDAARYFTGQSQAQSARRRAILIVTDNLSISYQVPKELVIAALYGADASLNAIVIGRHPHPLIPKGGVANPDFAPDDVFSLAEQTGGETIAVSKPEAKLAQMLALIRDRYSMTFRAAADTPGAYRHIGLALAATAQRRHPLAEVKTRGGYYVNR